MSKFFAVALSFPLPVCGERVASIKDASRVRGMGNTVKSPSPAMLRMAISPRRRGEVKDARS